MNKFNILFLLILLTLNACKKVEEESPIIIPPANNPQDQLPPGDTTGPTEPAPALNSYHPLGVGGGGAMSGVALSPYSNLWFVGTDMGTLFRSINKGQSWDPIDHYQTVFDAHLPHAVSPGFSSDGLTVFHSSAGRKPQRSLDGGITFESTPMNLQNDERILYWIEDSKNENRIFAGTTKGLLKTENKGVSWTRTSAPSKVSKGTFLDHNNNSITIYHAVENEILVSNNLGASFTSYHSPAKFKIRMFTAGRDQNGLTLAYGDDNGTEACVWAYAHANEMGQAQVDNTINNCGYVWIKQGNNNFTKSSQIVGNQIKMAENDSRTIYTTGGKEWMRQYGTAIHVSLDAGLTWTLKLLQINWDVIPFAPWPQNKIEYSAVAIDVGWWDSGYESFEINRLNSAEVAGAGFFFLHASSNKGDFWSAPFTNFADTGSVGPGKKWKTQGIEVVTIYRMKHHPVNKNLLYAAVADIGGMISDDNGESFRISKAAYNSNYDYAFDPSDDQVAYAASGNLHDWPLGWYAWHIVGAGGIYKTLNRGKNWSRLTPDNSTWNRQFLSVAFDKSRNTIYGGSQGDGIARSTDGGVTWNWFNQGLPTTGKKIIPQIITDPTNGNAYALLTGDAPDFTNRTKTGIYFLNVQNGSTTWTLLRGTVHYPPEADKGYETWWYPTSFAVDFNDQNRKTFWLTDYENKGNWLMTGAWKTTDGGQNWHRKVQMTHTTSIELDPNNSDHIFIGGMHSLDGTWGNGGQLFSSDGGQTWYRNRGPALQHNAYSSIVDPFNANNIFYGFFGGGILKGPNPARQPAAVKVDKIK
jgi:photosystem II stability/assembly factor-like uncharacterized protein